MAFIAFLGCDGSGKSSVIAGVVEELQRRGVTVTCGHWRPALSKDGGGSAADDPHGKPPRGTLSSALKLAWMALNWWGAWFHHLGRQARHGMVVFDRYHADLLVDPLRYRYGGPAWLAALVTRMMPQPEAVLFLDADPAVLWARKQEVTIECLAASRARYLELAATNQRVVVIDASQPLNGVIADVLARIGKPTQS